ncbi:MAG: Fic family protein [Polyangiaceae bacterium]|nr:Fic family protein [Polyangiaceae bacterium]
MAHLSTASFQPLVPGERALPRLLESASAIIAEAHGLGAGAGALAETLRPLLRAMNSFYTNLIEGQHTQPADIERALSRRFDADDKLARKQRLALAHIAAEEELEAALHSTDHPSGLFSAEHVRRVHVAIYEKLPPADRLTDEGLPIEPGVFRSQKVRAGLHIPPPAKSVPPLLEAWSATYRSLPGVEKLVVGVACSHHRLLWVHPFLDGNGRTARLHSHLVLAALGLTHGLWSPLRGMARQREAYYARLNNADLPRRNDLDGRGNLSQEELVAFCSWFLEVCLDQVTFMRTLLALDQLRPRLVELLHWLAVNPWPMGSESSLVKSDALEALHYVALVGPVERSRFMAMTGLPPRTARRILASLIDYGVLVASTPRAPVTFAVPQSSLRLLFPRLWPEAESSAALKPTPRLRPLA